MSSLSFAARARTSRERLGLAAPQLGQVRKCPWYSAARPAASGLPSCYDGVTTTVRPRTLERPRAVMVGCSVWSGAGNLGIATDSMGRRGNFTRTSVTGGDMTRADRRAEARAGRICPVCGKPLDARPGSIARMPAGWWVACQARSPRPFKGRLCPGQVRILAYLSERGLALTRKYIADGARVSPGWLPVYLGHVDPDRRIPSFDRTGIPCLLKLGYVREGTVTVDDEPRRVYAISPDGREALARCVSDATPPP